MCFAVLVGFAMKGSESIALLATRFHKSRGVIYREEATCELIQMIVVKR